MTNMRSSPKFLKNIVFIIFVLFLPGYVFAQNWNGIPIDWNHLKSGVEHYIMYNAQGKKVGSMDVETDINGETVTYKDISQFDDGSVYEEAIFVIDRATLGTKKVDIRMTTNRGEYEIDLSLKENLVLGSYKITQNGAENIIVVDSLMNFDAVRIEPYLFIKAFDWSSGETIELNIFAPLQGAVARTSLEYKGLETITTGLGTFEAFHYLLNGNGVIPSNNFWVDKETRKVVRIDVVGQELNIDLTE